MKKTLTISLILLMTTTITACSSLRFPGVYRVNVPQGNYIEEEMVEQLKVGMTRRQTAYVLGTPLATDTFNPDRWDYYYSIRKGEEKLKEYRFSVFFENDTLSRWEGDYEPTKATAKAEAAEALKTTEKKEKAKFK